MASESNREILDLLDRARREPVPDDLARDELVRRTRPVVLRYLFGKTRTFRRTPGDDDLADIVQESYLDAFRSLRTFDPRLATFLGWLCSIALRQAFKWLKRAVRQPSISIDDTGDEGESRHPEPASPGHVLVEQMVILKEVVATMAAAIVAISNPDYRLVMGLLFTGWFTTSDLETLLGWNLNTLKSAFRRGLMEMRAQVEKRAGAAYGQIAEAIIATHKKATLAKGASCLDVDALGRVPDPTDRELLRLRLLEGASEAFAREALGLDGGEADRRLRSGIDALLRVVAGER